MKKSRLLVILAVAAVMILVSGGPAGSASAGAPAPEKIVVKGSHELAKGRSVRLTAAVKPAEADQKVIWESDDPSVARVDKNGKVTGVKEGTVTVTASSAEDPSVKKKWKMTVYPKAIRKIRLSTFTTTMYMDARKTIQIEAKISPVNSSYILEWKSSNKRIATVSDSGVVTAKRPGVVTITASATDGSGVSASVTVTVEEKEPPLPETDPDQPVNYYALLIANSNYRHIQKLPSTLNDTAAMKTALSGLSQPWRITYRKNLTGKQIASAIAEAFRDATANDVCLFYYSGHGCEDMDFYPGALMGINYNGDAEESDLLTAARLRKALDAACPGRVIVILEACGSGAVIYDGQPLSWAEQSGKSFTNAAVDAFRDAGTAKTGELLSNRYTVMTTCEHGDYGVNLPVEQDADSGLLSYCTVRALGCKYPGGSYTGSMPADTNGDGILTLAELRAFADPLLREIKDRFPDASTQVFQYYGDNDAVLFAR